MTVGKSLNEYLFDLWHRWLLLLYLIWLFLGSYNTPSFLVVTDATMPTLSLGIHQRPVFNTWYHIHFCLDGQKSHIYGIWCENGFEQFGAAANFDDLVKFGDRRQIRRSQMFIKLAFEFGCDVILMSHPITRSLCSKLWQTSIFAMKYSFFTNQTDAVW